MKTTKTPITKEIRDRANKVFEQIEDQEVWVNENGVFFTSKNLALNSVKNDATAVQLLTREQLAGKSQKALKTLVVPTADGTQLAFIDLKEGDTPTIGNKAKIGNKNAEGVFKIDPQTSFKFYKGEFKEIIAETSKD